jgi:ribonucleoside-diphosphate reductase beta chain
MKYVLDLIEDTYTAADWSVKDDDFTQMFYEQNVRQFWKPEEVSLSGDLLAWKSMSHEEKMVYKYALAGLTLLDTEQGNTGMPEIMKHVKGHQRKALLSFMGMMENAIHARSYSNIFMTLASTTEIRELHQWVESNRYLQKKVRLISSLYNGIKEDDPISLYKAMVASTFLESFLFYSGFYYPLLCYGQGRMMQSGEIINLIIRDESIHGVYIGLLAQEIFNAQNARVQAELAKFAQDLLFELYDNELNYTEDVYDRIGVAYDVKKFLRYNANKALNNLGFEGIFPTEDVNPVVINGLSTKTKSHDFFSLKGNGYKIAIQEDMQDSDYDFDEE